MNFRQAVESPKGWNSMGYFCPKNTFVQLKHYMQDIYVTLLSTTCVKIHQIPYVISETISRFSQHNSSNSSNSSCHFSKKSEFQNLDHFLVSWEKIQKNYVFSWNFLYFWQKWHIQVQIFRLLSARMKNNQIPYVIFQATSHFSILQCHDI